MPQSARVILPAIVKKVIKPIVASQPEKVELSIKGASDLYREIRIVNTLTDEQGRPASLKEGANVTVIVEAPADSVTPKA